MPEITFTEDAPYETVETEMPEGILVITGTINPPEEGERGETYPLISIAENPGFGHWLDAMEAGRRKALPAKRWLTFELLYRNGRYTVGFTGQGSGRAVIKPAHLDAKGPQDFRIAFDGETVTYSVGTSNGQSKTYLTAEPGDDMVIMFGFPGGTKAGNKPPLGASISYEINLAEGDRPA